MIAGYTARIAIQATYFILVSKFLGPAQLGAFVAVVSLVGLLQPFTRLGSGEVLIRHVAISRERFPEYWGAALLITLSFGSFLALMIVLLAPMFIGSDVPRTVIIAVALADTLLASLCEISAQCFIAVEQLRQTARLSALQSFTRLIAAVVLSLFYHKIGVTLWSVAYLLASLACALYSVAFACTLLGRPRLDFGVIRASIKEGSGFAMGQSALSINANLDKVLLMRLATAKDVGIYAAASRLIDVAQAPAQSLLFASAARVFQQGARGFSSAADFAKRLIPFACGYSIAVGVAMMIGAPLIPYILGRAYFDSIEAIRWLSPIILFRILSTIFLNLISSLGRQHTRAAVQISMAVVSLGLNLVLIRPFSWRGAAWAGLISNGLFALGIVILLVVHFQLRSRRPLVESSAMATST